MGRGLTAEEIATHRRRLLGGLGKRAVRNRVAHKVFGDRVDFYGERGLKGSALACTQFASNGETCMYLGGWSQGESGKVPFNSLTKVGWDEFLTNVGLTQP